MTGKNKTTAANAKIVWDTLMVLVGNKPFAPASVEALPCFTKTQRGLAASLVYLYAIPLENGMVAFVE